ncbi:hypothetical protein ACOSQ2_006149 [Xanthoceras sorbifolium]
MALHPSLVFLAPPLVYIRLAPVLFLSPPLVHRTTARLSSFSLCGMIHVLCCDFVIA